MAVGSTKDTGPTVRLASPPVQHLARPRELTPPDKLGQRGRRRLRPPARQTGQAREHDLRLFEADVRDEVEQWSIFARALGKLAEPGSPGADALLATIEQRQGRVAWSAIEALEAMDEQRAIEPLLRRLKAIALSPPTTEAAQVEWETVAEALGTLRAREAVDPLIEGLQVDEFLEISAHALGDIGDPRAVPALAALLEVELSSWNANAVFVALDQIGTPEAKAAIAASEARGGSPPDTRRPPTRSFLPSLRSRFARLTRRAE